MRKKASGRPGAKSKERVVRPPQENPDDRMRPAFRSPPTPEQYAARRELVRDLMISGHVPRALAHRAIVERATVSHADEPKVAAAKSQLAEKIGWPFPERQTLYAWGEVRRELNEAFEADQPTARAVAAARLENDLLRVGQDLALTPPGRRGPLHHARARYHELLSKVQGTQAPTEIRVDPTAGARATLIAVVMAMGPEEQRRLVEEERRRLAEGGEPDED